jgi:hypothetical protein
VTDAIALPDGPALTALLVRMLGTATFVIVVALLSERAGPFLAAMMASLPIYTGPIYLFLAFEHGPDYLAQMAVGSTAIAAATPVFAIVYCILALRFGLGISLSSALLAWALAALAIRSHAWSLPEALLLCLLVFAVALPAARAFTRVDAVARAPRRWTDLPLRAALVALLVGIVTTISAHVPPMVTGIMSVVPIIFSSLILVLHPRIGGPATAALMAHSIGGLVGMIAAFSVIHLTIERIGTWPALLIGLSICVAWNLLLIFVRHGFGWLRR